MKQFNTATINTIITKFEGLLVANTKWSTCIREVVTLCGGTFEPLVLEPLAQALAKHYKVNVTINLESETINGFAKFHTGAESTRETRHSASRNYWERNVLDYFKAPESESDDVRNKDEEIELDQKVIDAIQNLLIKHQVATKKLALKYTSTAIAGLDFNA